MVQGMCDSHMQVVGYTSCYSGVEHTEGAHDSIPSSIPWCCSVKQRVLRDLCMHECSPRSKCSPVVAVPQHGLIVGAMFCGQVPAVPIWQVVAFKIMAKKTTHTHYNKIA